METTVARPAVKNSQPTGRELSFLLALGLLLGYAAFSYAGVTPVEWNRVLVALGVATALFWFTTPSRKAEPVQPLLLWLALAVVLYTAFQLLPLPPEVVGRLSPARKGIADALIGIGGDRGWIPLSVAPLLTLAHLLRLLAFLLVFLSLRELAARLQERAWIAVIPVVIVASLEAALGLVQNLAGAGRVTGTYANPNHLAGLLEMSLPFTLMLTVQGVRSRNALSIMLAAGSSVLLFTSLLLTASRAGLVATVASVAVLGGLLVAGGGWRRGKVLTAVAGLAVLAAIVFLAVPNQLLDRLADTAGPDVSPDVRFQIWRETWSLIKAWPLFGSGLGTYVSAIQQYRVSSSPLRLVDFAHNDYLQLLAEWGSVGFVPALGFAVLLLSSALRRATARAKSDQRSLAAACFAALLALAIHSLADFNLYIPANAMAAAWIAGIVAGFGAGIGASGV
jgi:O-antigen ligase